MFRLDLPSCPSGAPTTTLTFSTVAPGQNPSYTLIADGPAAELVTVSTSSSIEASSTTQTWAVSPGASVTLTFQAPSGIGLGRTITYTVGLNNNRVSGAPNWPGIL